MIKVGIIGCGGIGRDHARRVSEVIVGTKLTAVSDVFMENGRAIAEKYNCNFYEKGEDLIQDPNVDAVLVCTSDATHKRFVMASIEAGKYVFCEKPLGVTAKECRAIVDAEMACGKKLVQVGFMRRYDRGYRTLKEAIKSGMIGRPLLVHACHRNKERVPDHNTNMTVCNSGIHEIDVLRWLLDEDYDNGHVLTGRQNQDVDEKILKDPQIMLLQTKSGIRIDVEINMSSGYGYDIQCEVVGEKGVLRLPNPETIQVCLNGQKSNEVYGEWTKRFVEAYDVEFMEWADSIKAGEPVGPTAWDGYVACVTADTLVAAREAGKPLEIILPEVPDFYK